MYGSTSRELHLSTNEVQTFKTHINFGKIRCQDQVKCGFTYGFISSNKDFENGVKTLTKQLFESYNIYKKSYAGISLTKEFSMTTLT